MVNELYHHGIKGQKWGVRRFQDKNGKLTKDGRVRYGKTFFLKVKNKLSERMPKIIFQRKVEIIRRLKPNLI